MNTRGLVIGKFYPPHRGHKYLIDSAQQQVQELSVIICQRTGEAPAGELRAAWLREIHPGVRVILVDDDGFDPDDSDLWARRSLAWLGFRPDVVFTSEDYGERFAACLGCKHVQIDKSRRQVPISGSRVRADPLGCWEYLELPVRGYYAKRVCIVGAESTGKTTLAQALARHYGTAWVSEFGREFSERKLEQDGKYDWHSEDFVEIAQTQCRLEDAAAQECNGLLICDTDAFATGIWHQRYLGYRSLEVEAIVAGRQRADLYLLAHFDAPFVQDGTRDGELIREWMHNAFVEELVKQEQAFSILSGSYDQRFEQAVACVDRLMGSSTLAG